MIKIDNQNLKIETDCKTVGEFMTQAAAFGCGILSIKVDGCLYEFYDNPKIRVTDDTPLGSVAVERADSLLSGVTVLSVTTAPKPKTVKKSGFVNLYRGGILQGINCGYRVFASEQEAMDTFDMTADCEKFAVAKIEWEEVEK